MVLLNILCRTGLSLCAMGKTSYNDMGTDTVMKVSALLAQLSKISLSESR